MASWYVAVYAEKNGNTRGADRGGGGLSLACLSLVGGMLFVVSGLLLLLLLTFNTMDGCHHDVMPMGSLGHTHAADRHATRKT